MLATVLHCSVAGSHISAARTAPPLRTLLDALVPPVTSTLPSGSKVLFRNCRANAIGLTYRQVGVATLRLMTSAVIVCPVTAKFGVPSDIWVYSVSYMACVPFYR